MSVRWGGSRRGIALALTLIALLFQINAPIRATMMEALGPEVAGLICSHDATGKPDQKAPPADHQACEACVVCTAAGAILAPVLAILVVLFLTASPISRPPIPREVAPRAPPPRQRWARGPPVYA